MAFLYRLCLLSLLLLTFCTALNWKYEYNGKNGKYQYFMTQDGNKLKTWYAAREECMAEGGDLATIENQDEANWFRKQYSPYSGNLWIGLNDIDGDGTWEWADFKTSSWNRWASGNPKPGLLCAHKGTKYNAVLYSANCGTTLGFLCKRPKGVVTPKTTQATTPVPGFCPSEWLDAGTNRCYKSYGPFQELLTWAQAKENCQKLQYFHSDLACANTQDEVSLLTIMGAKAEAIKEMWIGIYRNTYFRVNWMWNDNSEVSVVNWHNGYRTNDYGYGFTSRYLKPAGSWDTVNIYSKKNSYICQAMKDPSNIIPSQGPTPRNKCQDSYSPFENSCYKVMDGEKSYTEAKSACSEGASMVSIHSAAENAFLQLILKKTKVWIGLKFDTNDHEYKWNNNWFVNYVNWGPNEPKVDKREGCVSIQKFDSFWYDTGCNEKLPVICKKTSDPPFTPPLPVEGRCPTEEWEAFGENCYHICSKCNKYWIDNLVECQKLYLGAQYMSIHHDVTNTKIMQMIQKQYNMGDSWLGLHISAQTNEWVWTDGSPMQYSNWAPNEPPQDPSSDKQCAYMEINRVSDGLWKTSRCRYTRGRLCQIKKMPLITTPMPVLGKCPSKEWQKHGAYCYLFRPDTIVNWKTATEICKKEGGYLVRINSADENDFLHHRMQKSSHWPILDRHFWIGLSKKDKDSVYIWMDGEPLSPEFDHWGSGQPSISTNRDCVQLGMINSFWHNEVCSGTAGYACKAYVVNPSNTAAKRSQNIVILLINLLFVFLYYIDI